MSKTANLKFIENGQLDSKSQGPNDQYGLKKVRFNPLHYA